LLAKPDLTLAKALELAQDQETAEQGAQDLQQQHSQISSLNQIGQTKAIPRTRDTHQQQQRKQLSCHHCGGAH